MFCSCNKLGEEDAAERRAKKGYLNILLEFMHIKPILTTLRFRARVQGVDLKLNKFKKKMD